MKKYVVINFRFDMQGFSAAVRKFMQENPGILPEMLDVDESTLSNWYTQSRVGRYKHPMMENFINACNAIDADPRQFFVLDE